ncbi:solute carrier family 2, facilitated glucose transporter member 3-like isoform X1 [Mercenaria mercenaria]|uniref:solute carrier family 2, facilitated glucose transporter member 3-like isoform X1 n=2 Tax=Mercenaria mercenaria TaxID=6596 RepID=UPI00234F8DC3|nr:solute carrier family 2, facilitated glucose transporter member 3-like isoform X1 [Mercenaria mercenaria]
MEDDPLLDRRKETKRKQIQRNGTSSGETSLDEIDHIDVMAIHKPKNDFTARLALSIAACTLGSSFQYGYNTGVVNAPEKVLKGFYNTTYQERHNESLNCGDSASNCTTLTILWATTVSIYCIGGMMGGVSAGYWANRFGRKRTLLLNNIIMVIALAVEILSKNLKSYEVLIIGRFIAGINAGINTGVAPMYLSEISTVSLRGLCGTFNQLCITFGVFTSTVMGLNHVLGTDSHWQYALGFPALMVVWQLCTLSFCPESPRFLLIQRNSEEEAERALVWLRGTHDVSDEIEEMIAEREHAKHIKKFTVCDLFHTEELRTPLVICLAMHLSQQLAGINAVIYYSTSIFETAGLSESYSQYATLGTGAVNVCMTFVSALIMDKVGRRSLHLLGLGGMFIASYILTLGLIYDQYDSGHSWVGVICVLAVVFYIIFFASGPGAIPWFFTAELFAQGPRPAAVSIGVLVNWSANFCVGLFYPFLQEAIKAYSFIPFVVFLAIFWVYTLFRVPETKGKTIEEITAQFQTSVRYSPVPVTDEND